MNPLNFSRDQIDQNRSYQQTKNTLVNPTMRFAEYGDQLVDPASVAFARGSGNYNPGPNYEETRTEFMG